MLADIKVGHFRSQHSAGKKKKKQLVAAFHLETEKGAGTAI